MTSALQVIGWPFAGSRPIAGESVPGGWAVLFIAHPAARPARIVEQHRSGYLVAESLEDGYPAESLPEWQRASTYRKGGTAPESRPAVGDWVLVEGEGATARIVALLPRYSAIKRAAAGEHYKQQLIAANVDTVFVVCGLDDDFNPRRIERYLLLVRSGGAEPVVVLTKADLAEAERAGAVAAAIDDLASLGLEGLAVVPINARDAGSVDALADWLHPGRTVVLVGSSGAGKSTLTNSLLGRDRMKTGEVRGSDSRGRHTTTHRALVPLPSGACLIDTPGMRELKPTGEEDVTENFSDIDALAEQCRFRDCAHGREPGCAVRAAIEAGTLDAQRVANYHKLRDEVAGAAATLADRRSEQKSTTRQYARIQKARRDEKYGED
ncbi:ribosome small subunit-dependent GTPase A [Marilutibacter spongiae]|uniref:Small ribosomal subunit biogenesis GTPase RsgA n=1 Tax=Marilutibacter spongiae TaxID=2025720 RepID=A0A7W3TMV6_9GAMM|nr:ribosome small subunit-dependent GTPase A [Lysobacter spongiae]MBB1061263.1 ribosome small subunit-dependent GTPase A [Lysobacter spongiae]